MHTAKDDLGLLIRAAHFAAQRHRDQRRKGAEGRPYINHPIELTATLSEAGVRDAKVLAAALLHDVIEDTTATYDDVRGAFGSAIADLVVEVTDTKYLLKKSRKRIQVARAGYATDRAKLIKLADKICNLRDVLGSPPADWSLRRRQEYFDWAKEVVDQARGVNRSSSRRSIGCIDRGRRLDRAGRSTRVIQPTWRACVRRRSCSTIPARSFLRL